MVLICIFLMTNDVGVDVLVGHLYIFFGEMPMEVLCLFLNLVVFLLSLRILFISIFLLLFVIMVHI